jgi:hypothetical protein
MRLIAVLVVSLGVLTGCGGVEESYENVKVEAVEDGFAITSEGGAEKMVSRVVYSMEEGAEAEASYEEMSSMQAVDICCAECHGHSDGTIHCTGCRFC